MTAIAVYYGDPFQYYAELTPEPWECRQYLVTDEERDRISRLTESYRELQTLLEQIRKRPEWDAVNCTYYDN